MANQINQNLSNYRGAGGLGLSRASIAEVYGGWRSVESYESELAQLRRHIWELSLELDQARCTIKATYRCEHAPGENNNHNNIGGFLKQVSVGPDGEMIVTPLINGFTVSSMPQKPEKKTGLKRLFAARRK